MVQKTPRQTTTPTQRADARLDTELRKLTKLSDRIVKARQQVDELMDERTQVAAAAEYAAANPALSPEAWQRHADLLATPEGGHPQVTEPDAPAAE